MRHLAIVVTFLSLAAPVGLSAQTGPEAKSAQPFKLGTFARASRALASSWTTS